MRKMILWLAAGALTSAFAVGCQEHAPAADNTKVNVRDNPSQEFAPKTPMDQGQNKGDIDITAAIRRDLMDDERLSMTAKNVKIISDEGTVTLRGPVKTADERAMVVSAAESVAGVNKVENELEIAP